MKADDQTILSLHNRLVTHNPRIGITHDSNNWSLHIRQVKEADKGCYMCQINTSIMKKQIGCIDVHSEYAWTTPLVILNVIKQDIDVITTLIYSSQAWVASVNTIL